MKFYFFFLFFNSYIYLFLSLLSRYNCKRSILQQDFLHFLSADWWWTQNADCWHPYETSSFAWWHHPLQWATREWKWRFCCPCYERWWLYWIQIWCWIWWVTTQLLNRYTFWGAFLKILSVFLLVSLLSLGWFGTRPKV